MSIAIIFSNKDPEPWAAALKHSLPDVKTEIYPRISDPEEVNFILCWKADKDILRQFPNVRVIQSAGASVDHILQLSHLRDDVVITRITDARLSEDMWEYLLTAVLGYLKNTSSYAAAQQQKVWKQLPYRSVRKTTVSILGIGTIGGFAAERFAKLGFKVKGWSASVKNLDDVYCYHGLESLGEFLKHTDVLINLLPFTSATANILNSKNLTEINSGGFLINAGRGEHLEEQDLISLLNSGHLSGAMLDVFRQEPLPQDHAFWENEKISITPHIAAITNIASVVPQIAENYLNLQAGKALKNTVSKDKGY
ncbi:glyoxylate/hydroxypyruvate reductase A [Pedobacter westerhofensis]|uniref:Glyoxylate/hydroxypyruvate reductase A n=1 Tax=Pedobacter westerhofensis TaxID=425512 RepID=A0A521FLR2_9SPHI|nr:glyoxylate/hydroxypyruvate reductase A [Pedobacter westerhofensis]SMO96401.1 glyoxylate/hydroxypyruvate reductase A [Pedobacter westerhofensis]